MLTEFLERKMHKASFKRLADKTYFGEIAGVRGVWANAKTITACRKELREVLEDWLLLKVRSGERVPGFSFHTDRRELVLG